ncbi:lipoprotein [Mycoplasmoides genitalium]
MLKKQFWTKAGIISSLMVLGSLITACSNLSSGTNFSSLNQLRNSFSKNSELNQDKKELVTSLRDSFEVDSKSATNVLLDAWRFSLQDEKILEKQDPSRFVKAFGSGKSKEDVEPSTGVKGLRLVERYTQNVASIINNVIKLSSQTVTDFSFYYNSSRDFKVQIRLQATGTFDSAQAKSYLSQIGLSDSDIKDKNSISADLIFTYTPPSSNLFSKSSFDTLLRKINFNTDLRLQIIGKDELMQKLLQSNFVGQLADQNFQDQTIDLLPYVLYSIL